MPSRFSRNGFVEWRCLMSEARRHFAPEPAQADGALRMNPISNDQVAPPPGRVKVAAVLAAGAIALVALDAGLELRPAPAPTQTSAARAFAPPDHAKETSGVRSLAYYPEQLAALTSLSSFTPGPELRAYRSVRGSQRRASFGAWNRGQACSPRGGGGQGRIAARRPRARAHGGRR